MPVNQITIGDIILSATETNIQFRNLYGKLLNCYGATIFSNPIHDKITYQEVNDLLRYADIFSKSNVTNKISTHRNIAQDIVVMLSTIFEGNNELLGLIKASENLVLSNVSNYAGLNKIASNNVEIKEDFLTLIASATAKSLNRVKGTEEEYYSDSQRIAISNLLHTQFYSFSAPTSMGKTYIIRNFLSQKLLEKETKCIAMILPTKALINEVEEDLIEKYETELKENNYVIITIPDQVLLFSNQKKILLFTPERLLQTFNENTITKIDYLFIDEAQKIFENDERTPYYYKIFDKVNSEMPLAKVYFSSPYAKNPNELLNLISNQYKENRSELAKSDVFEFSPVSQKQFLIDHRTGLVEIYNILEKTTQNVLSTSLSWQEIIEQQTQKGPTIVYCKSKNDVITYANEYAKTIKEKTNLSKDVKNLIKKVETDIHKDYYLIPLLKKGIAFHMGIMPSEIRKNIETIVKHRQNGGIDIVFCTSTLLEGVNLPAVNIFILSHHKGTSNLSVLEFKNLIGRAGRIRYSLWGNAFLLALGDRDSIPKYRDYFKYELPKDKLLPEVDGRKKEVATSLFDDKFKFIKKAGETYSDLIRFVMYRNVLASAILKNDKSSAIYNHYKETIEKELQSGKQLINYDEDAIADIRYAPETIYRIKTAIINGEIDLPNISHIEDIDDGDLPDEQKNRIDQLIEINAQELAQFYLKLYDLFQWDIFERKDQLGIVNLNNRQNVLMHYARLTSRWISGQRLSRIILGRIYGYAKERKRWDPNKRQTVLYLDSIRERNDVITEVMDEIENELKFLLSNYVTKFVRIYETVRKIETVNTIADYIDYGTMNDIIIIFQKMGLSRELAKEIFSLSLFDVSPEEQYYIKSLNSLLEKTKYLDEVNIIAKNLRSIFKE